MKKKLFLLTGICILLTGCGAKMPTATESVGFATEKDGALETEAAIEETETMAVTEDTEEEPDPEGTIRTTAEDLQKLPPEIQSIYNGNGTFYDLDEKKEFTKKSYRLTDGLDGLPIAVRWTRFLVADIDQDGEYELEVYMRKKGIREDDCNGYVKHEVRIFDLSRGTVYAHPYPFRGVNDVYENGVLVGSSGAADNDWYEIRYDGEKETQTVEAYSAMGEDGSIYYYVDNREVSEDEFYDYIGKKYGIEGNHTEIRQILWSEEDLDNVIE